MIRLTDSQSNVGIFKGQKFIGHQLRAETEKTGFRKFFQKITSFVNKYHLFFEKPMLLDWFELCVWYGDVPRKAFYIGTGDNEASLNVHPMLNFDRDYPQNVLRYLLLTTMGDFL